MFTQLLEMIEDHYGYGLVDQLLTESNLPSGGTYTAIGTKEAACRVRGGDGPDNRATLCWVN